MVKAESLQDSIQRSGRTSVPDLLGLLFKAAIIVVLVFSVIGCSGPAATPSLSGLYGKEVLVTMEPTVIATSSTSEVRENKMNGKLVSADDNWVVLNTSSETVALSRQKVTVIAEVQARP